MRQCGQGHSIALVTGYADVLLRHHAYAGHVYSSAATWPGSYQIFHMTPCSTFHNSFALRVPFEVDVIYNDHFNFNHFCAKHDHSMHRHLSRCGPFDNVFLGLSQNQCELYSLKFQHRMKILSLNVYVDFYIEFQINPLKFQSNSITIEKTCVLYSRVKMLSASVLSDVFNMSLARS